MKHFSLFLLLLGVGFVSVLHAQTRTSTQTVTDQHLYSVYFTDQHFGWAVGEEGTVIHTSDGGNTWTTQNSRTAETLLDVYFFDEFTGWIAGEENTLLHTDNGGQTWSDRRPSSVPGQILQSVQFLDWKRGWAGGGPGNFIYFTDDAGLTWQRKFSDDSDNTIKTLQFFNHDAGRALTSGSIFKTNNMGENWESSDILTEERLNFTFSDLYFIGKTEGFAIVNDENDGLILHSAKDGEYWKIHDRFPGHTLYSIHFTDSGNCWITGTEGLIMHSDNSGETWQNFNSETTEHIYDIHFPNKNIGWSVGSNGIIFNIKFDKNIEIPPYQFEYPSIRFSDDNEAIELLNRVLFYIENADKYNQPLDRRPFFKRVRGAITEVQNFYTETEMPDAVSDRIFEIITSYWAEEHNRGAEFFNEDERPDGGQKQATIAAQHFINAIILQPDSSQSYKTLGYSLEEMGRIDEAIQTFRIGLDKSSEPEPGDFDYLISLYLMKNDTQNAYELAIEATNIFPGNTHFKEIIADYYIENNKLEDAVRTLNELTDLNPENHRYTISKTTQNYQIAFSYMQELIENYENLWRLRESQFGDISASEERRLIAEIEQTEAVIQEIEEKGSGKIDEIISDLENVLLAEPDQEEAHSIIGQVSRSRASFYIEIITLTHEPDEIERFEQQIGTDLQRALTHYEQLVELNPSNHEYFEALYRVYLQLGMNEKASEIQNRF